MSESRIREGLNTFLRRPAVKDRVTRVLGVDVSSISRGFFRLLANLEITGTGIQTTLLLRLLDQIKPGENQVEVKVSEQEQVGTVFSIAIGEEEVRVVNEGLEKMLHYKRDVLDPRGRIGVTLYVRWLMLAGSIGDKVTRGLLFEHLAEMRDTQLPFQFILYALRKQGLSMAAIKEAVKQFNQTASRILTERLDGFARTYSTRLTKSRYKLKGPGQGFSEIFEFPYGDEHIYDGYQFG